MRARRRPSGLRADRIGFPLQVKRVLRSPARDHVDGAALKLVQRVHAPGEIKVAAEPIQLVQETSSLSDSLEVEIPRELKQRSVGHFARVASDQIVDWQAGRLVGDEGIVLLPQVSRVSDVRT